MSDDLVKRLRDAALPIPENQLHSNRLLAEAADEIESLRIEIEVVDDMIFAERAWSKGADQEVAQLRKDLRAALDISAERGLEIERLRDENPSAVYVESVVHHGDMCPNCVTPWKCNGPHES